MRRTHYASIALLLAVSLVIGSQFVNTVSGAQEETDFEDDDGVVESLQVSVTRVLNRKSLVIIYTFIYDPTPSSASIDRLAN